MSRGRLDGSVIVVSPHLDDAIFSVGAAVARATRTGARVRILTVFANDPADTEPPSDWERACGFDSAAQATRARRLEDARACARVGAEPTWLDFRENLTRTAADEEAVRDAVVPILAGADVVLLPGSPLKNPDHAWLTRLLIREHLANTRLGLYVEQPYAAWAGRDRAEASRARGGGRWSTLDSEAVDVVRKLLAAHSYRSQLRGLGRLAVLRTLFDELRVGGERVEWLAENRAVA